MVTASLMAALIVVCAWLSIPLGLISFTMQSFGVLLTLGILGGKWGTVSVLLYLGLGFVGLPVFSGFRGGAGAMLDATGGFLWGFLAAALVYWLLERFGKLPAMAAGMAACYSCGCWWFSLYAGGLGIWASVLTCVVPYLVPDGIKLWLAYTLCERMKTHRAM